MYRLNGQPEELNGTHHAKPMYRNVDDANRWMRLSEAIYDDTRQ